MREVPLLAGIPVNMILGRTTARRRLIGSLLERRYSGERWAVLDNAGIGLPGDVESGVEVAVLGEACMCCHAITLKVALTRLLRETRPDRLLIVPSGQARIPQLLRLLSDRWLAAVLQLRATIMAIEVPAAEPVSLRGPDGELLLSHAQVIAMVESTGGMEGDTEALQGSLVLTAPHAQVIYGTDLDRAVLDQPGAAIRPWFR